MTIHGVLKHYTLDDNGCWNWNGSKTLLGYGKAYRKEGGKSVHRWAWEHFNGEIPEGMFVCHHCDNPSCINPDHLFVGTHTDNMRDMIAKGRNSKGEDRPCAKTTSLQVIEIRRKYKGGSSASQLGKEYSLHRGTVNNMVLGITWKHLPGKADRLKQRVTPPEEVRQIRRLHKQGQSLHGIARTIGIDRKTVTNIVYGKSRSQVTD